MIETLAKTIAQLPYAEMMELASYIADHFGEPVTAPKVAGLLCKLSQQLPESQSQQEEHKILLQAFSRKRQINVRKLATGYVIEVPTLPGSTVTGRDLRSMLGQMLDQIVTLESMGMGATRGR